MENQGGAPNYFPNSFSGPQPDTTTAWHKWSASGDVARFETKDDDNFSQVGTFYNKVLDAEARDRLTSNIAGHLVNAATFIQKRAIANFSKADPEYGRSIERKIAQLNAKKAVL